MHLQRTINTRSCKSGAGGGGGGVGKWVGVCGSVEKNIREYATILLLHRVAEATIWTMKKWWYATSFLIIIGGFSWGVCPPPYCSFFLPKQAILSIKGLHPFIDRIIGGGGVLGGCRIPPPPPQRHILKNSRSAYVCILYSLSLIFASVATNEADLHCLVFASHAYYFVT